MDISLIAKLIVDTAFSWLRMALALGLSILFSWAVGIAAARNKTAGRIIIPVLDVLQSIPILGFFPIVLVVFVAFFPVWLGVNFAVIFLIFTSMSWNIAFAVYEAVASIPDQYFELASMEKLGLWQRLTQLYIPASWSKVAYNTVVSWSVGLFYLISSEIFSLGNANYAVTNGIGLDIARFAAQGLWSAYATAIAVLIFASILTRFFFLGEFSTWSEKFKLIEEPRQIKKDPIYRFYSWINTRGTSKAFSFLSRTMISRSPTPTVSISQRLRSHKAKSTNMKVLKIVVGLAGVVVLAAIFLGVFSAVVNSRVSFGVFLNKEKEVLVALAYSFVRIWFLFAIVVAVALPVGITIALHSRLYQIASPTLQVVSALPAPALLPPIAVFVATLPFGGELTAAVVIFLGTIWYIMFNVVAGIRSIPSEIFELAKLSRLKGLRYWKNVLIPAALPSFITGSITAIGAAWNTLIVAEYFNISINGTPRVLSQVSNGIGKLLDIAAFKGDLFLMELTIISMTGLILAVNILLWRRLYRYTTTRFSYAR
jgi:NitT/TauT family transport system permease protein